LDLHLKPSDIALYSSENPFGQVLFRDKDGNEVTNGDHVEFFKDGEVYPHYGYVDNTYGLKVTCYNQLTSDLN